MIDIKVPVRILFMIRDWNRYCGVFSFFLHNYMAAALPDFFVTMFR